MSTRPGPAGVSGVDPVARLSSLRVERGGRVTAAVEGLEIAQGEFVAIVGPNGAGKSTVLKALTGEWPSRGRIELFGRELGRWPRRELATRLAVMAQSAQLSFDFTVEEVVALGRLPHRGEPRTRAREAVRVALDSLGLLAEGARAYTRLSGGERQRVQFARVLAQLWGGPPARLLLLDEPTSALDLRQQRSVLELARRAVHDGASVVAVMHDLNLAARYADRVAVMARGALQRIGSPDECLTVPVLNQAFETEVDVERAATDGLPFVLVGARGSPRRPCAPD